MKIGVVKAVGVVVAGATLTGALVTWNGGEIINNSKAIIQDAKSKLEAYSNNEARLLSGIDAKNEEIALLLSNIDTLRQNRDENQAKIKELEEKIAELEAEKADLENQLNEIESGKQGFLDKISQLESQINEANSDVIGLQSELEALDINKYNPLDSDTMDELFTKDIIDIALSNRINFTKEGLLRINYSAGEGAFIFINYTQDMMTVAITYSDGEEYREQVEGTENVNGNSKHIIRKGVDMVGCTVYNHVGTPILVIK